MSSADSLPRLHAAQADASNPRTHVWLSASAGTGKTQVLAARVFRLLLGGTDPSAILCLTFTKAGAAEMAARINQRLAAWVRMPGTSLARDLLNLGERGDPETVERARKLFASVLDAPGGGLRIQTIHGFCQSLLAAFPVEAGLAPGFRPLEEREQAVLQRQALSAMLVAARDEGRERVIDAVGALSLRLGEGEAEAFLNACARAPAAMAALPPGEGLWAYIRRALDVPSGDVIEEQARCCGDDAFDLAALRRFAAANRAWGAATGIGRADLADAWIAAPPAARVTMLGDLLSAIYTQKRDLPKRELAKLVDIDAEYEAFARSLGDCCAGLVDLVERAAYADLLAAGLDAGRDYAAAYGAAKRRTGAVDFDDLIRTTVALLEQPDISDWVRYKLDQVTEHVLIDEAQDTNADQWRIVRAVADEFFTGRGTRGPAARTLFTVGDYKQAIFGFQGTDPINFSAAERYFSTKAAEARGPDDAPADERGLPFQRLSLTQSFRSTGPILEFVDAALANVPAPGLGFAEIELHASKVDGPGLVELWPPVTQGGDPEDEENWVDDATRKLADDIAARIAGWIADDGVRNRRGERIGPGDVMVLVKRRGTLAQLIVARLHGRGVPVAGLDRLRLNAPLAVRDLLATIRFVLQPDDDLALASLLVSPLIGWSQDQLMARATERGGRSLWTHLRATAPDDLEPLYAMLARADLASPYRFLEELLSGPLDGRRKLLRRLGSEARDPIEELLSAALAFETTGTPSLQLFLDWFDRGEVDIKRDPSQAADAVRVMTAHGAKGLQAPIVILADALIDPGTSPRSTLQWKPEGMADPIPIVRPRATERSGPIAELASAQEQRELEEHWRLFYVAATRAEERLVIAGALGPRAKGVPPANSWFAVAAAAMAQLGVVGDGAVTFSGTTPQPPAKPVERPPELREATPALPDWTRHAAPAEARPPRPLAPSSLGDDAVADPPPTPAMRAAAERGRLLHALFERLPAVPPRDRTAAADAWLAGAAGVSDQAVRAEIVRAACAVINDDRFAALFGANSLAEAPIAAVTADGLVIAGTADRLLVTPDRVQVVDFKTGRSVPAGIADIPAYHLRQMAAYAVALAVIFPDRQVEAALLYTAGPTLFALDAATLDRHKPGLVLAEQSLPVTG